MKKKKIRDIVVGPLSGCLPITDVVRCKNCIHGTPVDVLDVTIYCEEWVAWDIPLNGFCYKGKKRKKY